jgi:hypothetical protein
MAARRTTSQYANSRQTWAKAQANVTDLLVSLESRRAVYEKLPPEKQQAWRENEADPLLNGAWKHFLALAEFFGVEVPR